MNKAELKKWILNNCERESRKMFIGSNKYVKTFYLYGREELHSGNVENLATWLREIMDMDKAVAIKCGKKVAKGSDNSLGGYWETEGYIYYLMRSCMMVNE